MTDEQRSTPNSLKMKTEGMRRLGHAVGGTAVLLVVVVSMYAARGIEPFLIMSLIYGIPAYGAGWVTIRTVEWIRAGFT